MIFQHKTALDQLDDLIDGLASKGPLPVSIQVKASTLLEIRRDITRELGSYGLTANDPSATETRCLGVILERVP